MTNREKYASCWKQCPDLPIFLRPWWMDAACGEHGWDCCISLGKDGTLRGVLPYFLKISWGIPFISNPPLTPYTGIWLNYPPNSSPYHRRDFEKKVMKELLEQLPSTCWYRQRCHYSFSNWLPFRWKGFSQTTHNTFLILGLNDMERVEKNIHYNVKWEMRKALRQGILVQSGLECFEEFCKIYNHAAIIKGIAPLSLPFLKVMQAAILSHEAGEIFVANDGKGNTHAAAFLVWDEYCAYYWLAASNPVLRKSGAVSLLLWKALQHCAKRVNTFDFDGSIEPGIEQFFGAWGGIPTPCPLIFKGKNRLFEAIFHLKNGRQ